MRVETITRTLYKFDELSDDAKENARNAWRASDAEFDQVDAVIEDAQSVAQRLGIEIGMRTVRTIGGKTRQEPMIHWSGFCSQGDGASYAGTYTYNSDATKKVKEHAPNDCDLHEIATALDACAARAKELGFQNLSARVTLMPSHYSHSNTMSVELLDAPELDESTDVGKARGKETIALERDVEALLRYFADWIYTRLRTEYEYCMSDEYIDETLTANNCEFTANGMIA